MQYQLLIEMPVAHLQASCTPWLLHPPPLICLKLLAFLLTLSLLLYITVLSPFAHIDTHHLSPIYFSYNLPVEQAKHLLRNIIKPFWIKRSRTSSISRRQQGHLRFLVEDDLLTNFSSSPFILCVQLLYCSKKESTCYLESKSKCRSDYLPRKCVCLPLCTDSVDCTMLDLIRILKWSEGKVFLSSNYFWQNFPITQSWPLAQFVHTCPKISVLYWQFWTLRHPDHRNLKALQDGTNASSVAFTFENFILDLYKACFTV